MEAGQNTSTTVPGESTPGEAAPVEGAAAAEAGAVTPAPEEGGAEEQETLTGHKLTPEAQAAFNKRVGELTAARRSAEERAEAAAAEAKELRERVEDAERNAGSARVAMAAAEKAGVLPDLVQPGDVKALSQAASLRGWRDFYEGLLDSETPEYEGKAETGRDVKLAAADIRRRAREMGRALETVQGREQAVLESAPKRLKALVELGKAAEKAGWSPKAAVAARKPAEKPATVPGAAPRATPPAAATPQDGNHWKLYREGKITEAELHERLGSDALARSAPK